MPASPPRHTPAARLPARASSFREGLSILVELVRTTSAAHGHACNLGALCVVIEKLSRGRCLDIFDRCRLISAARAAHYELLSTPRNKNIIVLLTTPDSAPRAVRGRRRKINYQNDVGY